MDLLIEALVCAISPLRNFRTSSLKYHLNAKHLAADPEVRASTASDASASNQPRQATLHQAFRCKLSESTCDRPTNSLAKWVAMDCRPVSVVEDRGTNCVQISAASLRHICQNLFEFKFLKYFHRKN